LDDYLESQLLGFVANRGERTDSLFANAEHDMSYRPSQRASRGHREQNIFSAHILNVAGHALHNNKHYISQCLSQKVTARGSDGSSPLLNFMAQGESHISD
jgi:hypothetical protein